MNLRRALVLTTLALLLAPIARSGHEQPVYPSYYPHEIEIATVEPKAAAELLGRGKLHAYVGGVPGFAARRAKDIAVGAVARRVRGRQAQPQVRARQG